MPPLENPRTVLIIPVWGDRYIELLIDVTLRALLAPGNYPALAAAFDCELVFVTEKRRFAEMRQAEIIRRFSWHGRVRFVAIDEFLLGPGHYGMTLTLAYFSVIREFDRNMVDTQFLFLNADFVLADDSYRRLIPLIQRGERVICSPTYCTIEENILPILQDLAVKGRGVLAASKRELAELILRNLHDTVRAQMIDACYHYDSVYIYQHYVQPDARILLGRQMPICVIAMRPTKQLEAMNTFWDWGVVSELCPGADECVLGDSDEFLILELRSENTGSELLRLGPPCPERIAASLAAVLTRDQRHFGRFPLSLHSRDLPGNLDQPRAALREFHDRLIALIPLDSVDHRNHAAWLHHYRAYLENRKNGIERDSTATEEVTSCGRANSTIPFHDKSGGPKRTGTALSEGTDSVLRLNTLPENEQPAPARPHGLVGAIYDNIFGRLPQVSIFHPYWTVFRNILMLLDRHAKANAKIIIVADEDSSLQRLLGESCDRVVKISSAQGIFETVDTDEFYDLCYCEIGLNQLPDLRLIVSNVARAVKPDGRVLVFVRRDPDDELPNQTPEFVRGIASVNSPTAIYFGGSELALRAITEFRRGRSTMPHSWFLGGLFFLFSWPRWGLLALQANRREAAGRHRPASLSERNCTDMTIEYTVTELAGDARPVERAN